MKYIRLLLFALFMTPVSLMAAQSGEFMVAAQLLAAAKNADIQQVEVLINNGADVNFVDSTGLSIVCTALMNNDVRAAQILQMYGADASQCDKQIKKYNSRNKQERSGGLFSGLSSAHTLTLAAAGAAVVVGGLLLLTDVFDGSSSHDSSSGGGDRPNNDNNGGGNNGGVAGDAVPVGPAFFTQDGKIAYSIDTYRENLNQWNPVATNTGLRSRDFNFFRPDLMVPNPDGSGGTVQNPESYLTAGITLPMQNYLLMMHGYSAFANGYLGHFTFRDNGNNPVRVLNATGGGMPVSVGMITANGMNPVGSAGRSDGILYATSAAATAATTRVDKYLNYNAPTGTDNTLGAEISGFDLSNSGTAMNPFVSANDNALGKIVAGWEGARPDTNGAGDLYGFVPNARLGVWRTGGGYAWDALDAPQTIATIAKGDGNTDAAAVQIGDTITYNSKKYKIVSATADTSVTNPTFTVNGKTFSVAPSSSILLAQCDTSISGNDCTDVSNMAIYQGTDNKYYINYTGANRPDAVFVVDNGNLVSQMEWQAADVKNYQAMTNAVVQAYSGALVDAATSRTSMAAIANTALNPKSRELGYYKMSDMPGLIALGGEKVAAFVAAVNKYYDVDETDTKTQGAYANELFGTYSALRPIIVNPAGEFMLGGGDGASVSTLDATFENYAPLVYSVLNHNFMTVVAVAHTTGTAAAGSIEAYGDGIGTAYGPLYLSLWQDGETGPIYQSRRCGVAGSGENGIDPWCFAAAGPTTEMATASAAGAVAALRGAFTYMTNAEIFALMALTADGAYLGTDPSTGAAWGINSTDAKAALVTYLKSMYSLPPEYRANDSMTSDEYLRAFREVYGYGLINLERAMTPGKKIYYYDGSKIVSADKGNAYWRAASNTNFRMSSAFGGRGDTVSAPFFDVLESADGELCLPRVWENQVTLGASRRRGLYMADVFDDLKTGGGDNSVEMGDIRFSMTTSPRMYSDNMGGLDTMNLGMRRGNWDMNAGYQHRFTDGAGLFSGMANPIMSLASDALHGGAQYSAGKWRFGMRGFSGAVTDNTLLENDPTVSAEFAPARMGLVHGGAVAAGWGGEHLKLDTSIGMMRETETVLGAATDGLLALGGGDTSYIDMTGRYDFSDRMSMMARATFARTVANPSGQYIMGLDDIDSNAFALGLKCGGLELVASRPLAVTSGQMRYAYADYDVVDAGDGRFDIVTVDTGARTLDLRPTNRETRISLQYRHNLGVFTDAALGMIYRINPDNTDAFGDETVFMLKLRHRLGI